MENQIESGALINRLNDLLSTYHIYYQNLRSFHWRITGPNFFDLHAQFETLYTDANLKIDEIAERILSIGAVPETSITAYLERSSIKEANDADDDTAMVSQVVENLTAIIAIERDVVRLAEESGDSGTVDTIDPYIAEQEKTRWMFRAWLKA